MNPTYTQPGSGVDTNPPLPPPRVPWGILRIYPDRQLPGCQDSLRDEGNAAGARARCGNQLKVPQPRPEQDPGLRLRSRYYGRAFLGKLHPDVVCLGHFLHHRLTSFRPLNLPEYYYIILILGLVT